VDVEIHEVDVGLPVEAESNLPPSKTTPATGPVPEASAMRAPMSRRFLVCSPETGEQTRIGLWRHSHGGCASSVSGGVRLVALLYQADRQPGVWEAVHQQVARPIPRRLSCLVRPGS
jgi:hypothetical protein